MLPGVTLETFKLTLNKWQLDDAHKDKQHKIYSPDFQVHFRDCAQELYNLMSPLSFLLRYTRNSGTFQLYLFYFSKYVKCSKREPLQIILYDVREKLRVCDSTTSKDPIIIVMSQTSAPNTCLLARQVASGHKRHKSARSICIG